MTFLVPLHVWRGAALLLLTVGVVAYVTFALIQARRKRKRLVDLMNKLPHKKGHFLLGHVGEFIGPREERFEKTINYFRKFGDDVPVVSFWIGTQPRLFLMKAAVVEALLTSDHCIEKSTFYRFLHPWLGQGLLTSKGAKWHDTRKLVTSSFHFGILVGFVNVFNKHARILTAKLEGHVGEHRFNVYPLLSLCTLDVICETAMRKNLDSQRNEDSAYVRALGEVTEMVVYRVTRPWLHCDWLFNMTSLGKRQKKSVDLLHNFTNNVIAERRRERNNAKETTATAVDDDGRKQRVAFLDTILGWTTNDGRPMKDDDLRAEVDTFMFGGHDTSACALSWFLFLVGHHPEVQSRCQDELDAVFGTDTDRTITIDDLSELKYLERTIKETLRLKPPAPFFARHVKQDVRVGDYTLPAGAMACVSLYLLHRDPDNYTDPERFDPDRFLPENSAKRHPFSFIPFSAGSRNCVGQKYAMLEMKVIAAYLLRNFKVTAMEGINDVKVVSELVLRPVRGMWIRLEHRHGSVS